MDSELRGLYKLAVENADLRELVGEALDLAEHLTLGRRLHVRSVSAEQIQKMRDRLCEVR